MLAAVPAEAGAATIDVVDMAGRRVKVPADPKRIVGLGPGALRLICYLHAVDKVVGIEAFEKRRRAGRPYWYANPSLAKKRLVAAGGPGMINKMPDMEKLLAVRPDLIFITYMQAANADRLQAQLKVPVVVLSYGRFATFDDKVFHALKLMGRILKKDKRAEAVVGYIKKARQDLARRTRGIDPKKKPTVYVGAIGFRGLQGITSTDVSYASTRWLGANNVAARLGHKRHAFINKEKLLAWNPDVIFVDGTGLGLVRQDVAKNPKFYQGLKAFKTRRVYVLHPYNWYVTNIGTAIISAYVVGKRLYPDRFKDVDLKKKADQVYTFMVGKPVYKFMVKFFGQIGRVPSFVR
jgi:iron complex transport system substrate-binding protein